MADQRDPLKPLLDQVAEILNLFYKSYKEKLSGEAVEDFSARLEELKIGTEYLQKTYELALQQSGITEREVIDRLKEHPDYLTEKDKQLLNQIGQLRNEAMAIRDAAEHLLQEEEKKTKEGGKKGKKRKQSGKNVGTRKGWKKM